MKAWLVRITPVFPLKVRWPWRHDPGHIAGHALPRRLFGVRLGALLEVLVFIAVCLLLDQWVGKGDRFATVTPHPFWIAVLLASAYYGTAEGLVAALLCAIALLAGNLPPQRFDEDIYAWLLRVTSHLSLWCVAAVLLGGIERARRSTLDALREELGQTREQARAITADYEALQRVKQGLEARIAGQVRTVYSIYKASRAIERQGVGEVLMGVAALVQAVIGPRKFSLFLLEGSTLEAAVCEGWTADDVYQREFEASSLIFQAVVMQHRLLVFADPAHAATLGPEGLLAGPLMSSETGETVGMLKIESLAFHDLNPSSIENFRLLCDWIGTAFANAQRAERLQSETAATPLPQHIVSVAA